MVKRWCVYLAGLLGCMIFYLANQQWLSWVLMWTVVSLPGISLLLSLPGMITTRLVPSCSPKAPMGGKETVAVERLCPFPAPYCRYQLEAKRTTTGEKWILPGDRALSTDHCGKLMCRVVKGRAYDFLGLFFLPVRSVAAVGVAVMPIPVALKSPPELERYMAAAWQIKPGGGMAENHELRLYRPGDNLRQIHWKLSAKTGKLVIREAMEPRKGRFLLTMDICGTAEELDRKFGSLLWMGAYLLDRGLRFEIRVLSGSGMAERQIAGESDLLAAVEAFLGLTPAREGSVLDRELPRGWHFHIGGGTDEG